MRRVAVLAVVLVLLCILPAIAQVRNTQLRPVDENGLVDLSSPQLAREIQEMRAEIRANGWTFEVGVNPAMRYPLDRLCGRREELLPPDVLAREYGIGGGPQMAKPPAPTPTPTPPSDLPSIYVGVFTPPKDQGNCGSCWAFGTIDEAETAVLVNYVRLGSAALQGGHGTVVGNTVNASAAGPDLSEQHVVSCNPWNWGCNGGNDALAFLVGPYDGAVDELCFHYTATNNDCANMCADPTWTKLNSWGYADPNGGDTRIPSVSLIKQAIYTYGAVTAYVYVDRTFQAYTGGVYNNTKRYRYTNHQIQLVGWDDSKGAWLLKNSWGTDGWGIGGYMWITYGSCRVGEGAAWATY